MDDAARWSEEEYNRLLRMCDPRMLTAHAAPRLAGLFGAGHLAPAIRAVAQRTIAGADAAAGACDLVVALDPDRDMLAKMRHALQPGGICYCVWPSARASRADALVERISAAGFSRVTALAPWPAHLSPRRKGVSPRGWLPPGDARTLRWIAARQPAGRSGLLGQVRRWHRSRLAEDLTFRLASPVHVLAFQEDSAVDAVPGWIVGLPQHDFPTWALLTEGAHSSNKVIALGFAADRAEPTVAVKMPRLPGMHHGLAREWSVLTRLGELDVPALPGIPCVLGYRNGGGPAYLVLTALPGTPLLSLLRSDTAGRFAGSGSAWLTTFALRTIRLEHRHTADDEIERSLTAFDSMLAPSLGPRVSEVCRLVRDRLVGLPTVAEHRDFAPWNLVVADDGTLGVVDWESAILHGVPGCDLIYYLLHLFHLASPSSSSGLIATARTMRDTATPVGRASVACLAGYFSALGLDPTLEQPLRLLTWMVHAVSVQRRNDAAGPDGNRTANPFVDLWKQELAALNGNA
jgi:hypothetical protein